MKRFVVHESDLIRVWCDPELGLIHHQILGYCHGTPFRDALSHGTDALTLHGCWAWLSDDRRNGPLSPEDAEWAKTRWFPSTRSAGWTHWAMVRPERVIAQLNVQQFLELYKQQGVVVAVFSEVEPALEWIRMAHAA